MKTRTKAHVSCVECNLSNKGFSFPKPTTQNNKSIA